MERINMKLGQAIELTPDEIKLACILYVRESATGKMLQGLGHPDRIRAEFVNVYDEDHKEVVGLKLILPEVSIGKLGDDDGLGG